MTTYETILIKTAREFTNEDDLSIVDIARIRAERAELASTPTQRNDYVRVIDHFDNNGQPVFKWENWGYV